MSKWQWNDSTEIQMIQFLNYVFVPVASVEESAYEEKDINMKHVLGIVNLYTDMMIDKTVQSFSTWCKKRGILMLNAPFTRKRRVVNGEISSIRLRRIFVLKKEYLDSLVKGIVSFIPVYQKHIKRLKEQRFSIIGYARKSPGNEEEKTRIELLQKTVNCLSNRSLVDKVFVSFCCSASDPLASRDLKDNSQILGKISNATGNTQG
ncbi:hypothetical protein G6F43_012519 [Rhizopus delemar]|nr:hypothetical protein G6F43_012519 [Rhizopus delemar]